MHGGRRTYAFPEGEGPSMAKGLARSCIRACMEGGDVQEVNQSHVFCDSEAVVSSLGAPGAPTLRFR